MKDLIIKMAWRLEGRSHPAVKLPIGIALHQIFTSQVVLVATDGLVDVEGEEDGEGRSELAFIMQKNDAKRQSYLFTFGDECYAQKQDDDSKGY